MGAEDIPHRAIGDYIKAMLEELADLADLPGDSQLSELAFRMRLMADEGALTEFETKSEEIILSSEKIDLQLVKICRSVGSLTYMPTFSLICSDGCPEELCPTGLIDARDAVDAFMTAQTTLKVTA